MHTHSICTFIQACKAVRPSLQYLGKQPGRLPCLFCRRACAKVEVMGGIKDVPMLIHVHILKQGNTPSPPCLRASSACRLAKHAPRLRTVPRLVPHSLRFFVALLVALNTDRAPEPLRVIGLLRAPFREPGVGAQADPPSCPLNSGVSTGADARPASRADSEVWALGGCSAACGVHVRGRVSGLLRSSGWREL